MPTCIPLLIGVIAACSSADPARSMKALRDASLDAEDGSTRGVDGSTKSDDAGSASGDASSSPDTLDLELCDGTHQVKVFAARSGTGIYELGAVPVYLNLPQLVLDGECTLYLLRDELSELRAKHLDDSGEQELIQALKVDFWRRAAGDYCTFIDDGPLDVYWLDHVVVRNGPCRGPELPTDLGWKYFADYIASQYETATAVDGDLWYTLVADGSTAGANAFKDGYFRNAKPWPLDGDPAELATSSNGRVQTYRAVGDDAQALRNLRARVVHGSIGSVGALFLPIEQPDGSRFQLRIRDTTPFDGVAGPAVVLPD
jgi:hypothetical protein